MAAGFISVGELRRVVATYLRLAYPTGVPASLAARLAALDGLADEAGAPEVLFETSQCMGHSVYALRMGQPRYPHMKIMVEPSPAGSGFLYRADAHDSMLHAPPGSLDAGPLAELRAGNKLLTEAIEAAWTAEGLPTFRAYLRAELERRKRRG